MRVLIVTQHFVPEITAARVRLEAFARGLAGRGHEVEVICAMPNHPEGVIHPGYRGRLRVRKRLDGIPVSYMWLKASPRKTAAARILLYASFATTAAAGGMLARRPDVVLVSSPPLPAAAGAAAAAVRHRVPWVMDVRDLWPEAAVVLGELTSPTLVEIAERLERRLYRSAAAIVTVTDPFRSDIAAKLGSAAKVTVIPNGTTKLWLEAGSVEVDREELGFPGDRFIWTYAGNIGIAQGLDAAIDAAGILGEGFRLVIIGEGPALGRLRDRAASLAPGLVEFRPPVQPELAAHLLRASDALLVPLDRHPALAKFVPSKLFDCCAVGRPVIVAADGEARRLSGEAEAAVGIEPGNPDALAAAVGGLRDEPAERERLADRGRAFAAGYLREEQVGRLAGVLERVAGGPSSDGSAR